MEQSKMHQLALLGLVSAVGMPSAAAFGSATLIHYVRLQLVQRR